MFTCTIENVKSFKSLIEVSDKILDEVKFMCDNEGLRFNSLDRSHVSFFNVIFDKNYFIKYVCDEPETITVDTGELLKVLKRSNSDDLLTLTIDDYYLSLLFEGESERIFKIRIIDSEYDSPNFPNITFPINELISYKEFSNKIKDAELYSDVFHIIYEKECLFIKSEGDLGTYDGKLNSNNQKYDKDYESIFSLDKIKDILKLNIGDEMRISFGNELPLLILFEENDLIVKYLIAPRISEDY